MWVAVGLLVVLIGCGDDEFVIRVDAGVPEPDANAAPIVLAEQPDAFGIAVAAGSVHFATNGYFSVLRVPTDGGAVIPLAEQLPVPPQYIVLDDSYVYVTSVYDFGSVGRISRTTGEFEFVAEEQRGVKGIALDDDSVYWATVDDGTIMKRAKSDGAIVTLATGQPEPWGIAVDDAFVYWANSGSAGMGDTGSVAKIAKDGGDVVTLASGQTFPLYIALDDARVYWSDPFAATVSSVAKDGGEVTILASDQVSVRKVAVDADSTASTVYFAGGRGDVGETAFVRCVPASGGAVRDLWERPGTIPLDLALDDEHVFWTDFSAVWRMPK